MPWGSGLSVLIRHESRHLFGWIDVPRKYVEIECEGGVCGGVEVTRGEMGEYPGLVVEEYEGGWDGVGKEGGYGRGEVVD